MKDDPYVGWLLSEGAITYEENVVYAERAFVANSILKWCAKKAKEKNLNEEQMHHYLKMLHYFIKKKIDLSWKDGIINASVEKTTPTTNGGNNNACGSVEI